MKKTYLIPVTVVEDVELGSITMANLSETETESGGGLSGKEIGEGLAPGRVEWEEF